MKIVCLLGSPKGENSVTLHYLKFIAQNMPKHEFRFVNIGGRIKQILADKSVFNQIIEDVRGCDGVIWASPVYWGAIPAQMKQFVEAVFACEAKAAFKGKYAMSLVTSIVNFYDHTTLQYLQAISEDLGLRYVHGYSCEHENIPRPCFPRPDECNSLLNFVSDFIVSAQEKRPAVEEFMSLHAERREYLPQKIEMKLKQADHKILLLTDAAENSNLARMTDVFVKSSPYSVEVVHLRELDISGGCLGCLNCFYDGTCVYKDGFVATYRAKCLSVEAVIYAITIKDRFLSAQWKMFLDRSFFNGHGPECSGPQVGFLIAGPLKQLPMLRDFLQGISEYKGRNVVGFVSDESEDSAQTTALLKDFARRMVWSLERNVRKPVTFLGLGGKVLQRDFIYRNRAVKRREHRLLKVGALYDFPRFSLRTLLLDAMVGLLLRKPHKRRAFYHSVCVKMLDGFKGRVEIGARKNLNGGWR